MSGLAWAFLVALILGALLVAATGQAWTFLVVVAAVAVIEELRRRKARS